MKQRRCRELYMITVDHNHTTSTVNLPAGTGFEEAHHELRNLEERHKGFTDSVVQNFGKPVYRLWRLWRSTDDNDTETF